MSTAGREIRFEMLTRPSDRAGLVIIDFDPDRPLKPVRLAREASGIALYFADTRYSVPDFETALELQQPSRLTFAEVDDQYRPRRTYKVELP